jgi:hypothetical protein
MTPERPLKLPLTIGDKTYHVDPRSVDQFLALNTHSTPWRPAGATLARLIDISIVGIPTGAMSRHDVGASIQLIAASWYLYRLGVQGGLHASATSSASLIIVELDKLAAAGSEEAAAALIIAGQTYHRDGIAVEAFAAARTRIEVDQA